MHIVMFRLGWFVELEGASKQPETKTNSEAPEFLILGILHLFVLTGADKYLLCCLFCWLEETRSDQRE